MTDDQTSLTALGETEASVELTMFDKENPRSLINIVWTDFIVTMDWMLRDHSQLLLRSERSLYVSLKPDTLDDMLRLRFWQEYDRAQLKGTKMILSSITAGLCSKEYWRTNQCMKPLKCAYLLTPMAPYITRMESSLYIAQQEVHDILKLSLFQKQVVRRKGREDEIIEVLDHKLLSEKVKLFAMLDVRVKGAVIQKLAVHQRIDSRTQITNSDPLANLPVHDLEAIEKSLRSVKRQIDQAQAREVLRLPESKQEFPEPKQEEGVIVDVESTNVSGGFVETSGSEPDGERAPSLFDGE